MKLFNSKSTVQIFLFLFFINVQILAQSTSTKSIDPFLMTCSVNSNGSIITRMENGKQPYDFDFDESTEKHNSIFSDIYHINNLDCGVKIINIKDADSKESSCTVLIQNENYYEINLCGGEEFIMPILECIDFSLLKISRMIEDELPEQIASENLFEPIMISENKFIKFILHDDLRNVIGENKFDLFLVNVGESCTDNDECTIQDVIDDNCNCIGLGMDDFEINHTGNQNCSFKQTELEVTRAFNYYQWLFLDEKDGLYREVGNDSIVEIYRPGQYKVKVGNSRNCTAEKIFNVIDYNNYNLLILSSKDKICNLKDTVDLWLAEGYRVKEWFDKRGKSLGSSSIIQINAPGVYTADCYNSRNCLIKAKIKINFIFEDIFITPADPVLCEGKEFKFGLSYFNSRHHSVKWSADNNVRKDSIIVSTPGVYSVTVTRITSGCEIIDKVEILESKDIDIERLLLLNGFQCIPVKVLSSLDFDNVNLNINSSCNFEYYSNFVVSSSYFPADIDIVSFLDSVISNRCCSSDKSSNASALFLDNLCNEDIKADNLDYLLNYLNNVEYGATGYLLDNTVGGESCLFFKSKR